MIGEDVRLIEHRHPGDEMEPYERLLGDAMRGDRTLFGSEAGVEAAWRIVDPILKRDEALYEYDGGSWGPAEAEPDRGEHRRLDRARHPPTART